jgi:hypothetical protein
LRGASASPLVILRLALSGLFASGAVNEAALERLGLDTPRSLSDRLYRVLVSAALSGH